MLLSKLFFATKIKTFTLLIFLFVGLTPTFFTQTKAEKPVPTPETFFFSFTFKSRLNPEFKLCVPVTEGNPFQIEWKEQKIHSSLNILVKKAENGKYPVRVTVKEGTKKKILYNGMEEPKLKLDKPYKSNFVASSVFNNTYEKNYNLSKKGCDFREGKFFDLE